MIENKKASILLILKVLQKYSDENHYLTQKDIINKIKIEYDIDLERKSVASSLNLLIELGYDINKGTHGGVALFSRDLEVSEVKYLVDAIYSSKVITSSQANKLTNKLMNNLSIYQRKDYSSLIKSNEISRTNNNQIFYTIEIINEAIKRNKKIRFNLISFNELGEIVLRLNGFKYEVSPYYLINNNSRYYLLCNYKEEYHPLNIFRLDYIVNIEITDTSLIPINHLKEFKSKSFKIEDYINDHIYMLGGEVIKAKLKLDDVSSIRYIKDYFGNNVTFNKDLTCIVKSDELALVYFIMQYGETIKVLSPDSLINKILEVAKRSFEKYKGE